MRAPAALLNGAVRANPVSGLSQNRIIDEPDAVLLLVLAGSLSGCASGPTVEELISLTPEHFRDTATVKDDVLETTAVISTENGYVERGFADDFLRAFIDKKTGAHDVSGV